MENPVEQQNKQAVVLPEAEAMVERFMKWCKGKYQHCPEKTDLMLYHDFLHTKIDEGVEGECSKT
jgi:hypothetical protein